MRYTTTFTAVTLIAMAAPALSDVPRVVTDLPAVHSLTAQVMGDLGAPEILLDQGADPHSFQLRPSQAAALADADLLFWIGPELTPWLARAVSGTGLRGEAIALLEAPGTFTLGFGSSHEGEADGHHEHEHEGEEAAHDDHDGHDHHGVDPHAWLDPENARLWLDVIAAELAAHDEANAPTYRANAENAKARIDTLEAEISATLEPVGKTPLYVFHDAYGYFAAHFGLNIIGTVTEGDATTPGAARLSDLRSDISEGSAVCIFPEAQHDSRQVAILAEGSDIRIGDPLDPEGSSLSYGPALYEKLMQDLATTIASCVAGAD